MLDSIKTIISAFLSSWNYFDWNSLVSTITVILTLIILVITIYNFFKKPRLYLSGFKKETKISYENNKKIEIYAIIHKKGNGIVKNCIIRFEFDGHKWENKIYKKRGTVSITTEYPLFLFSIDGEYIKCDFKSVLNGYKYKINGLLSDYMDEKFKFTIISENAADIMIEKKVSQILKNCNAE